MQAFIFMYIKIIKNHVDKIWMKLTNLTFLLKLKFSEIKTRKIQNIVIKNDNKVCVKQWFLNLLSSFEKKLTFLSQKMNESSLNLQWKAVTM